MTWLTPIPGLIRDDTSHTYQLHGAPFLASVTGVLRIQKSDFAMARIQATTAIWRPRGHNTHRALELHLNSLSQSLLQSGRFINRPDVTDLVSELDALKQGPHQDWINPLLDLPLWSEVEVIASERPTCCLQRNIAGTFDLAYRSAAGVVLADLKTLGTASSHTYCTRAQLGGYMALDATWGHHYDYGQTIWARPGQASVSTLYSRRECLLAWAAAWTRYQASKDWAVAPHAAAGSCCAVATGR